MKKVKWELLTNPSEEIKTDLLNKANKLELQLIHLFQQRFKVQSVEITEICFYNNYKLYQSFRLFNENGETLKIKSKKPLYYWIKWAWISDEVWHIEYEGTLSKFKYESNEIAQRPGDFFLAKELDINNSQDLLYDSVRDILVCGPFHYNKSDETLANYPDILLLD